MGRKNLHYGERRKLMYRKELGSGGVASYYSHRRMLHGTNKTKHKGILYAKTEDKGKANIHRVRD